MSYRKHEEVTLSRDVEAIVIPHGFKTTLTQGSRVQVMQELGGSVTVTAEFGGLYRIDPENLDAIGMQAKGAQAAVAVDSRSLEERVWEELRSCYDPEIPVNIVELGLVYDCRVDEADAEDRHAVHVKMTLTAPGCGMGDVLAADARKKIESLPGVSSADVEVVFDPPWNQSMMSEAARLQLGFF